MYFLQHHYLVRSQWWWWIRQLWFSCSYWWISIVFSKDMFDGWQKTSSKCCLTLRDTWSSLGSCFFFDGHTIKRVYEQISLTYVSLMRWIWCTLIKTNTTDLIWGLRMVENQSQNQSVWIGGIWPTFVCTGFLWCGYWRIPTMSGLLG